MKKISNNHAKKGVLALIATGVLVGAGIGVKTASKKIKSNREKAREKRELTELENSQFED